MVWWQLAFFSHSTDLGFKFQSLNYFNGSSEKKRGENKRGLSRISNAKRI